MSGKMTLREYLTFRALISREIRVTASVDRLLQQYPDWDPSEKRTWEAWKDAHLPFWEPRAVETAQPSGDCL